MHIAVIGNGIIGTCIGAYLQRDGHSVTFVDPLEAGEATSFGNAGSISGSVSLPVGLPGMWKKVPGWLTDPLGPLTIRPAYALRVLPWLLRFLRHSTRNEVVRLSAALSGLLRPVFDCYEPLLQRAGASGFLHRNGCLYVYSSREAADRARYGFDIRRSLGAEFREIGEEELAALEPDLRGRFRFAVLAPESGATDDPSGLTKAIFAQCVADGAAVRRSRAKGVRKEADRLTGLVLEDGTTLDCDGVVVASGAWSGPIAEALDLRVPLETQRGYHVTVRSNNLSVTHPITAPERSIFASPMRMGLRLAGTVEFAGLDAPPNWARADALLTIGREMFPHLDTSETTRWMGHRPCLPDSLPVIGRSPRLTNAWVAFGHGHLGMCLASTTGREVANLVSGRAPEVDLAPFSPTRFG
ncbi:NAD(P)/FAD-dependent oxidoreductase [Enterovirga rhinocerotis]|uniref:D-amino-acid dehydrogenase n=1 Tax=Enterovirga rhinocerotis TaxID=1339210 RepID=A0A4R7BWU3_9HYPH|nr:FAD-dependent oxidoreductase [Enterovirga rhinocerotis]TDR90398.1 D-amino-acid dehydrogenase [Enterovirga rhinocerotis]